MKIKKCFKHLFNFQMNLTPLSILRSFSGKNGFYVFFESKCSRQKNVTIKKKNLQSNLLKMKSLSNEIGNEGEFLMIYQRRKRMASMHLEKVSA